MATLEFLEDENGEQQALDFIDHLADIAIEDPKVRDLVHRIEQMLDVLEDVGVPPIGKRDFERQKIDGTPFMLAPIIKDLKRHHPLYEARVNYNRDYAFRLIFFYDIEGNEEVLYFTRAVLKDDTGVSKAFKELAAKIKNIDFDQACYESEKLYRRFSLKK